MSEAGDGSSEAAPRPERIVDAHVHLWDPAREDWYPYLSGGMAIGMGDVTGMARRFDAATYLSEAAGWNVVKLVNVAAATGEHSIEETLALDEVGAADGHPDAIIGGVSPTGSAAEAIAQIDRQMSAARFRGVRPMGAFEGPLPSSDVLQELQERDLVFELLARPPQLGAAADGLAAFDSLTVVVEHVGWPRSADESERSLWSDGLDALAGLGDHVVCKLSGLAMPLGTMSSDVMRPWIEHAIETFGVDRCMFASNFPVDGLHGSLDELYRSFAEITSAFDATTRDKLFAANAERVYRC